VFAGPSRPSAAPVCETYEAPLFPVIFINREKTVRFRLAITEKNKTRRPRCPGTCVRRTLRTYYGRRGPEL